MKRLSPEKQAGIYLTVIAHLAALIVLIATGLTSVIREEGGFVLDFSRYEEVERAQAEVERLARQAELLERINDRLSADVSESASSSDLRNVAVDRAALRDDRGTDAEQLYREAERLQQELKNGYTLKEEEGAAVVAENSSTEDKRKESSPSVYTGPSVISYELAGRKASSLPIPAYRCMGGGQVTVTVTVNPSGDVVGAKINDRVSSEDECLRAYALRAARMSRFSAKSDAPARQEGTIVYEFIAQ